MPETFHILCPDCLADNVIAPGSQKPAGSACAACGAQLQPAPAEGCAAEGLQRFMADTALPLLVYFHAPGCTPCTLMTPIIDRLAKKLRESMSLAKIDARQEYELAAACGVSSVPCILLLVAGCEVRRFCGAMDIKNLSRWIIEAAEPAR